MDHHSIVAPIYRHSWNPRMTIVVVVPWLAIEFVARVSQTRPPREILVLPKRLGMVLVVVVEHFPLPNDCKVVPNHESPTCDLIVLPYDPSNALVVVHRWDVMVIVVMVVVVVVDGVVVVVVIDP